MGGAGLMMACFIYLTEVKYPIRVVIRRKRENGGESVDIGWGCFKDVDGVKNLYLAKDKVIKALDKDYNMSMTTGLMGRRKMIAEIYSPRIGVYHFVKPTVVSDEIMKQVTSQSDKLMYQNILKQAAYLTEKKKDWSTYLPQILNVAMPIIVVLAVIILFRGLEGQIIGAFVRGAELGAAKFVEGVANAPVAPIP